MTEDDWWSTAYPDKLLSWLFDHAHASERKLRLFALACCRQVGDLLTDDAFPPLLGLLAALADGPVEVSKAERLRRAGRNRLPPPNAGDPDGMRRWHARNAVLCGTGALWEGRHSAPVFWTRNYADAAGGWLFGPLPHVVSEAVFWAHPKAAQADALAAQLRYLRDLFGPLPFRDRPADPRWLTADVRALAGGIDRDEAFDRLPILADALQDAGCDDEEVLAHCRDERAGHVRGCWAVDLVLGRPWQEAQPHPRE